VSNIRTNDLVLLMDNAEKTLTADNWHAEAIVMREAAERIRVLAQRLRKAGLSAEEPEIDPGRVPPRRSP
jgi:hypothetical protein